MNKLFGLAVGLMISGSAFASQLDGSWNSICYKEGNAFGQLHLSFNNEHGNGHVQRFNDSQCRDQLSPPREYFSFRYLEGRAHGEGVEIDVIGEDGVDFSIYRIEGSNLFLGSGAPQRSERPKVVDRDFYFVRQ